MAKYDANLVVIGAGSGGLVSAYIAAAVKAKVFLVERHKMGGDCLNTGCVPSKAILRSAKVASMMRRAEEFGLESVEVKPIFKRVMQRVHNVIAEIEPHDSVERYTELGVDCVSGEAEIVDPHTVKVGDRTITTKSIVIAAGASPFVPPIPGIDQIDYLTSDNVWQLEDLPKRLVVLGGGPIGCELSQAFAKLGSEVTIVEMADQLMGREDPDVVEIIEKNFGADGIQVLTKHKAVRFSHEGEKVLHCESDDGPVDIPFDQVLVAVGRKANTAGMNLEKLGIKLNKNGTIETDEYLRTAVPNIFACGDIAGPYQFTHTASHQAWYVAVNALFGFVKKFKVDYRVIPWATFTAPEVARVGLSEGDAKKQNIAYEVTRYGIDDLDRAIADGEAHGFVKIITPKGKDKILGVTIVGPHAGELIAEYVLAMKHNLGLNKILGTIHLYPSFSEANKYVAGNWKRAHQPHTLLKWVEKFHNWRRR
ncbi:dihydrolipoamide dehydrogenase [Arenicella xantha]|uniref:Dihydrolipoyl dehydrogenase n=1 Tax=Arenicella xantha TaxID=644221 RepID=A0A395JM85_9GAMM|nr:dihydrolipoyl dehydrogenase [Arenicella xantha]RBP48900.1 dihydrolipoamide dehydrogenase [Arenicella xantha]